MAAKVTHITEAGNQLLIHHDNGVKLFARPTQGGLWLSTAGPVKFIRDYGNQLLVRYATGVQVFARPTQGGLWVVGTSSTPPPTDDFKWPFDKDDWTTYPGHSGLDWPYASGTDIPVIGDGVVEETYTDAGGPPDPNEPYWRGNCIVVNHGTIDGIEIWSLYAHMLNPPGFSVGTPLVGGQLIGDIGDTGYSFGAHLHFEIIYDGVRLSIGMGGAERTEDWMNDHTDGSNW